MANDNIPNRSNWFATLTGKSIFDDKEALIREYMTMLFNRTIMMFEYEGLPQTIPKYDYQIIKQTYGSATITKVDDKLYALFGALGGEYNAYYHPTLSVVANPYLKYDKSLIIGKDCVVIKNDQFYRGLFNINRKYAELLTECDISMRKCVMNIRIDNVVVSEDESTDDSIKKFFESVVDGKFAHITSKKFMDDTLMQIHNVTNNSSNPLKDLIETRNYIESCWWMLFGLNANDNKKREYISDAEIDADDKTMIPFIEQMLECEQEGWNQVNAMYGTSVKVRLSDLWLKVKDEVLEEPKLEEEKIEDTESKQEDGDSDVKDE